MLAVVFGCERFHKLLYEKHNVVIESDHNLLESIMKKTIHSAPLRIQKNDAQATAVRIQSCESKRQGYRSSRQSQLVSFKRGGYADHRR